MFLLLAMLLPIMAAPLVYFLQYRSRAAALMAAAISLIEVALVERLELGVSLALRGRLLVLTALDRHLLAFLALLLALAFVYTWARPQGVLFLPCGLIALGLAAAVLAVENLLLAALLLGITLLVVLFLLPGEDSSPQSIEASFRCLVQVALAVPCLLLLVYLLEERELHPESRALLLAIRIALALGFGILLAAVPFHGWLSLATGHAAPLHSFVLMLFAGTLGGSLFLAVMGQYPWLGEEAGLKAILRMGGLLTSLVGGILALCQRRPQRLWGYSAIADAGCLLVGLGTGSLLGLSGAVLHLVARGVSLLLVAIGLDGLRGGSSARLYRWGAFLGGMGLAGFPPLGGFASRWLIYRAAFKEEALLAYLVIASSGLLMAGFVRFLAGGGFADGPGGEEGSGIPLASQALVAGLVLASFFLGLFPQSILGAILQAVEGL